MGLSVNVLKDQDYNEKIVVNYNLNLEFWLDKLTTW
jgi:hypothetical protein